MTTNKIIIKQDKNNKYIDKDTLYYQVFSGSNNKGYITKNINDSNFYFDLRLGTKRNGDVIWYKTREFKSLDEIEKFLKQNLNDNSPFIPADYKKIAKNTDNNWHIENYIFIANKIGAKNWEKILTRMKEIAEIYGSFPSELMSFRSNILSYLENEIKEKYGEEVWG